MAVTGERTMGSAVNVAAMRNHLALVRTLLDELERLMPPADKGPLGVVARALHEQSVEEMMQLSEQVRHAAMTLAALSHGPARGSVPPPRAIDAA